MTKIFNRYDQKNLRNGLRNHLTKPEAIIWSKLKGKQVNGYKFRRQHGIGKFIVDFFCPELMLAIEIDGANHFFDDKATKYGSERQRFIELRKIKVLRISNTDIINNLGGVMDEIYELCRR